MLKAQWNEDRDAYRLTAPAGHRFVTEGLHEYVYWKDSSTLKEARADAKERGLDVEPCASSECDWCSGTLPGMLDTFGIRRL